MTTDRMVGESYRDACARLYGQLRAAEKDRDRLAEGTAQLLARCDAVHTAAPEWNVSARPGGYLRCCDVRDLLLNC